jgi:hypothetical protein
LEAKPDNAVSIIECDMDVDFAPPVGYTEPTKQKEKTKIINKTVILWIVLDYEKLKIYEIKYSTCFIFFFIRKE